MKHENVLRPTPVNMNLFMKQNYDDFENLEFVKSIEKEVAKKIFDRIDEHRLKHMPEVYFKEIPVEVKEYCKIKKEFGIE